MGFCVGPLYAAIVGVYRGAVVYMVVVLFHSPKEMCIWSEDVCGMLAMCDGFMGNVQWYLRVGACYPTTGICVGVL
jgi:hypothetical protein